MSYTIVRRDFLKCALASAVVIPVLAGCGIFAGHSVPSRGWCRAFVQRS